MQLVLTKEVVIKTDRTKFVNTLLALSFPQ